MSAVGSGAPSSQPHASGPNANPALPGGSKGSELRATVQRTAAPGIAPPNRYRATTCALTGSPAESDVAGATTSTWNLGARYSSTRKDPPTWSAVSPSPQVAPTMYPP